MSVDRPLDVRVDPDDPIIDRSTRTLRRWVTNTAAELVDETGEDRWSYLSFHDLRRTWAGSLANADVDEQVALLWGVGRPRDHGTGHLNRGG